MLLLLISMVVEESVLSLQQNGATDDAAKEAITNIAMQVAAMNPQYISRNDISDEELAKLRDHC